ncbi:MAG: tRNA(m5U54)methyltransferase [Geoglossum simile]|nr:MAG: tRNA(m5U54)methyltransferase [Geoglossum simile]
MDIANNLWPEEPPMFRSPILRLLRAYSKQISGKLFETLNPPGMSATIIPESSSTLGFNEELRRNGRPAKKRRIREKIVKEGSSEEILLVDIKNLLAAQALEDPEGPKLVDNLPEPFTEIDLTITELSSTGDGLAIIPSSSHVCVVPFAVPGDRVTAKVIRHVEEKYSISDFVKVLEPSPLRDDSRIRCSYFATCGGCQFQMLDYNIQLTYKKRIVEKAFKNFSGLNPELVPPVGDTIGSPLQYGYRTKLTPHFDGPPGWKRQKRVFESVPPIGFMKKGMRKTIDIEDCPIGTDSVREGMKRARIRVMENIKSYKKGATLLLRESTKRIPKSQSPTTPTGDSKEPSGDSHALTKDCGDYIEERTCITNSTETSVEYVDGFIFENPAGAFFQNNNSILPIFTDYVRRNLHPPPDSSSSSSPKGGINYLVDAYCGSGLFTITCSEPFAQTIGIDISSDSISFARRNAVLNSLPPTKAIFIAADAPTLFANITFPSAETALVIDPPRKGCDEGFLKQLVAYSPRRIVYVSCNVHTQARDVGFIMREDEAYILESVRGFDFFPQTGHVESVAVLKRMDDGTENRAGVGTREECSDAKT